MRLLDPMFAPGPVREVLSDRVRVQRMLDFEAALAHAEAQAGVIPQAAAAPIARCCNVDRLDLAALAEAAAKAGNLAIPLVRQLTALVAKEDAEAAKYVHWGATSQDAIDTGLVLQLREALGLVAADAKRLADALAQLAERHRATPMVGRTWMQHALPITLGLKAAGWLDALDRHRERLDESRSRVATLQFGGAAGTLAALGDRGLDVADALAGELRLARPAVPWHAHRDRVAEVATTLGLLVGTLGKIARDLSLAMQTDVGELAEPAEAGRGGSSTMPHKRNPVACAAILATAVRVPGLVGTMLAAMVQEQERALGGWQAEWETLPEIVTLAAGAVRATVQTIEGLEVDAARMRENLDATHGLILAEAVTMALGPQLGRQAAHHLVEQASREAGATGRHLHEILAANDDVRRHLSLRELDGLLDPANYLGLSTAFVDEVLAAHHRTNDTTRGEEH
jgi:3-carboxy-cis,cis-muconate cycloisomerase